MLLNMLFYFCHIVLRPSFTKCLRLYISIDQYICSCVTSCLFLFVTSLLFNYKNKLVQKMKPNGYRAI